MVPVVSQWPGCDKIPVRRSTKLGNYSIRPARAKDLGHVARKNNELTRGKFAKFG